MSAQRLMNPPTQLPGAGTPPPRCLPSNGSRSNDECPRNGRRNYRKASGIVRAVASEVHAAIYEVVSGGNLDTLPALCPGDFGVFVPGNVRWAGGNNRKSRSSR
jgi:hypothetical protein